MSPRRANIAPPARSRASSSSRRILARAAKAFPTIPKPLDFGLGAGFYVDATEAPWSANYRMWTYVTEELPALVAEHFPIDMERQGITGHSMGGHGALTVALRRHRGRFRSVSAFAPIVAPSQVPWGEKALSSYLGPDRAAWRAHDAGRADRGWRAGRRTAGRYRRRRSVLREGAQARTARGGLRRRRHPADAATAAGYDHSYYFISTFMADHVALARRAAEPMIAGLEPGRSSAQRRSGLAAGRWSGSNAASSCATSRKATRSPESARSACSAWPASPG